MALRASSNLLKALRRGEISMEPKMILLGGISGSRFLETVYRANLNNKLLNNKVTRKGHEMNNRFPKFLQHMHGCLFNEPEEPLSEISNCHREIALIFALIKHDDFLTDRLGAFGPGRPKSDRVFIVRAFIAKAYLNIPTTAMLHERLQFDGVLRRLCGWLYRREVPCEATFSNAFHEFAISQRFNEAHDALIARHLKNTLVFHISRNSTAIDAREKKVLPEQHE